VATVVGLLLGWFRFLALILLVVVLFGVAGACLLGFLCVFPDFSSKYGLVIIVQVNQLLTETVTFVFLLQEFH
jgi:hypothetical protein